MKEGGIVEKREKGSERTLITQIAYDEL